MAKPILLLACLLHASLLTAQSGQLKGLTKDVSDKPLSGVLVEAILNDTIVMASTTSDSEGRYALSPLDPGSYIIRVGKEGYQGYLQRGVVVSENRITFMDIKLTPHDWKAPKKMKKRRR